MQRVHPSMTKTEHKRNLAVFIDLENLAMGFQSQRKIRFEVQKVLERLVEKGQAHRQEGLRRLESLQEIHRPVA